MAQTRKFISQPRCIYTGKRLDPSDEELKPSHEHIIPLSLGGSNQFTTDDVSLKANNKAGDEIDDAVASTLPFLMLRHRYKLPGNRKVIPSLTMKGDFIDINAPAEMSISAQGDIEFEFRNEQKTSGKIISLGSTEERVRFFLKARLEQAQQRKLHLYTQFGEVTDEEDIEIALLLANRNEGREFKARATIDVAALNEARARLMVKIALGLGHRVLGPEWTFGPGGMMLRSHLFPGTKDLNFGHLKGTINADIPELLSHIFGLDDNRHVMAVLPAGKQTFALISLFGGQIGNAIVDLGYDSRRKFNRAINKDERLDCAFSIPLNVSGSRPLVTRSVQELANTADFNNLLPKSRAEAERFLR
ncbi:hypothetical protein [Bradyrhizobium diversitatis]|uniref:HNH endonuclease n=1 Tax=Bradyrhizobium diversitatis TaxID=2755406 RepID=A0ABS0PEN0_9BRAD|nr:hypothetical protein [Bradyrhizobium diversitatis]MBH5391765.1 hypothetical protein [Bradyrhizobium diversitatis]